MSEAVIEERQDTGEYKAPKPLKINPAQVVLESAGRTYRHFLVTLNEGQNIAEAFETPAAWVAVQGNPGTRMNKGDSATIVSGDGLALWGPCMVVQNAGGNLTFHKPLQVVKFDQVALFADAMYSVVHCGTGFSIETVRDRRREDHIFHSEDAAKYEILSRQPKRN